MVLDVRDEVSQLVVLAAGNRKRAIQAFLALALLQEKVPATVALHHDFAASGATDALLGAAV